MIEIEYFPITNQDEAKFLDFMLDLSASRSDCCQLLMRCQLQRASCKILNTFTLSA